MGVYSNYVRLTVVFVNKQGYEIRRIEHHELNVPGEGSRLTVFDETANEFKTGTVLCFALKPWTIRPDSYYVLVK